MLVVLSALVPIAVILILGKVLASVKLLSAEGWIGLERITYFVLFPALIVSKLAVADFSEVDWRMPTALVGAQVVLGALSIAGGLLLGQGRERLGVYVQSAVRWNTFFALALAQELMGPTGLALVAIAAAAMIPTANILSVVALMQFSGTPVKPMKLLKELAVNPLVLACAVGLTLNLTQLPLPESAAETLDLLAQGTIALGLLTTGAAIQVKGRSAPLTTVFGWSLLRLTGLPVLAGMLATGLGVSSSVFMAMMIATAVPTAVNGTILARQLGADAPLAANLIACQTVLAIGTISAVIWAAGSLL
ncbi:MAG: AEC family transporter [Pseudomonadota bacterium]